MGRNLDGRLEVFAVGPGGRLWHRWQWTPSGTWSGWYDLGGSLAIDAVPAIGTSPDGRQEVFVRGANGGLHHIFQTVPNGGWSDWSDRGGAMGGTQAAVGTNADGRLEVFARAVDGSLVHWWQLWVNGHWSAPESLGGGIAPGTAPSVGTAADGRQQVVVMGTNGYVYGRAQHWANGLWADYAPMGGPFPMTAGPVVGTNADGRLEIFAIGPFALLVNSWQTAPGGAPFSGFGALAGFFTSTPTVVRDGTGKQSVVLASWFGGAVSHVRQQVPNGGWGAPATVGGATTRPVAAGVNTDGRLEVVYADAAGALLSVAHVSPPG